jgi:two-component system chemotaxis sensor kinase CheA
MENVPIIPRGRTSEFKDLINDFINETFANLDQVEQLVESLGTDDVWLIEQHIRVLFRTFHSIKGVAGFLQFEVMQALTHDAETLFDEIRRRPARQGDAVLRAIYAAIDCMRFITDTVRQQGTDTPCRERAEAASAELRRFTPEEALAATSESQEVASSAPPTTKVIGNQATAASETSTDDDALRAHVAVTLRESSVILMTAIKNLTLNEDTPGRIIHIHNVLIELLQKRCLPNESTAQSVAQSASVFSDMMASGDLSLDEYTILTLQSQIETLVEAIDVLLQEMSAEVPLSEVSPSEIVPTLLPTEQQTKLSPALDQGAHLIQTERSDAEVVASTGTLYTERSEIRVETVKLDRLFDLVGELVTIQTMTLNSPDLKGMKMPNFRKSATMLTKITRQLQTATMSMRMTPIEILFAKMKRIAREVGTHIGKQIELQMSGADTEMDKNVIELMFDPLVHIIRNSIDHGIEPPAERERLGKSTTGVIHLSAMYEGSEIVVSVRDDGAGLNRANILRRAIERGIASADSENLSDAEVWNFIFEPGFSTAQTVTELSGRGVGMDVVKKNIEKLRGSVQVRSREGKGTTITLRIPLTLASMDVMLVRVGTTHYAIPLGAVRQSFRPRASDVTTTMDGVEIVRVRETLYPVLRLHEIFALRPDNDELEKGILIIVEVNAQRVCLSADEVIGQQQTVIKPLSEYIGSVAGLSGYMILSDGRIGLILDVEGLIHSTEESISAAAAMAYTAKSGQ